MFDDRDMKIAGDKPSRTIGRNSQPDSLSPAELAMQRELLDRAGLLGAALAGTVCDMQEEFELVGEDMSDAIVQRRLLRCFAVPFALDKYAVNALISRTALNAFYNTLKRLDVAFYDDLNNNGAFSFYFLAGRSTGDAVRRIGQTFAMLCSHDGDPVFQELGETLFCRYVALVRAQIDEYSLLRDENK